MTEDKEYFEKEKKLLLSEIARLKDREARILRNFNEDLTNIRTVNENQVKSVSERLDNCLPDSKRLRSLGLFYHKDGRFMNELKFAVAKKETLTFDKYQIGRQIYILPDEHKKKIQCVLLAYFDVEHKFMGFGTLNRRLDMLKTFHSNERDICLGENYESAKIVDYEKPETIVKAFDGIKDTLETINPESYLTVGSDLLESLHETRRFVDAKRREFSKYEYCDNCEQHRDECGCTWCENCDRNENDCECSYCNDCERYDDNCVCDRCSNCGNRLRSEEYNECDCVYCDDCAEYNDDCNCERCSDCENRAESSNYDECDCKKCSKCDLRLKSHNYEKCKCEETQKTEA